MRKRERAVWEKGERWERKRDKGEELNINKLFGDRKRDNYREQ